MDEQKIRDALGKNIKKYRKQLHLSQEKLAATINIATNFLSEIENGRKWISPTTLAKLIDALDIEIYELFVDPFSTHEELERLYQTVANNIERVVGEAVEKALAEKL
jgi:transcriptional regulator with XRE-family HTH domain